MVRPREVVAISRENSCDKAEGFGSYKQLILLKEKKILVDIMLPIVAWCVECRLINITKFYAMGYF